MATTRFHSLLRERAEKHLNDKALQLQSGNAQNYEGYKYEVGYAQGVLAILAICEDIEGEFDGSRSTAPGD